MLIKIELYHMKECLVWKVKSSNFSQVFDFNEVSLVEDTPQNLIADGTADSASTAVASSTPVKLQTKGDTATLVMLLSYQRSGSSFIGGIFTDPENVFYVYEPLDPLYSAMYGTEDGWAVPSDIFSNKDGTLRYGVYNQISSHELER